MKAEEVRHHYQGPARVLVVYVVQFHEVRRQHERQAQRRGRDAIQPVLAPDGGGHWRVDAKTFQRRPVLLIFVEIRVVQDDSSGYERSDGHYPGLQHRQRRRPHVGPVVDHALLDQRRADQVEHARSDYHDGKRNLTFIGKMILKYIFSVARKTSRPRRHGHAVHIPIPKAGQVNEFF